MAQSQSINIIPDESIKSVHVSQGDIGRRLVFNLFEGSTEYYPQDGAVVRIRGTKPSGYGYTAICTLSGNVASVETTEGMTDEFGNILSELQITVGDTVLGTANFILSVEKNPHPDSVTDASIETAIQIETRMDAIESRMDAVEDAIEALETEDVPEVNVERAERILADANLQAEINTTNNDLDALELTVSELNAIGLTVEGEALIADTTGATNPVGSPLLAFTSSDMTDSTKIYVYVGSETGYTYGNWYYYDGSAWVSGGVYNALVVPTDTTLSVSGMPADAKVVGDEISELKSDFGDVTETIYPKNIYNPSEAVQGTLNTSGGVNDSTYITTGMIPVSQGDVLYAYYVQNGEFKATNIYYVVSLFDESQTFISRTSTLYSQSYTVPSGAKYIRATFQITYTVYKNVVMVTRNETATQFEAYFTPEITAIDRVARETIVNKKIIDCWGDSRVEMIATAGTAFSDYLLGLLGSDYITANYGISSQNANMVACRFGSNEVYVTFENNQIPASGNANITEFKCSVGGRAGEDFRAQSINVSYGVRCEIAGIKGTIIRRYSIEQYFVRDEDGVAITVKPRTKILVPNYDSKNHVCIFWAGKNDFGFNTSPRIQGIIVSVESMVKALQHNYFVILGETYSVNDNYASSTVFRNAVDTINSYYAVNYPENYIDIQAELISKGLILEGITPTEQDTANIANGFIPDSLMADAVHPNEKGREAIAKIIYSWMQSKEWV